VIADVDALNRGDRAVGQPDFTTLGSVVVRIPWLCSKVITRWETSIGTDS
jgi:hypothetical protein